MLVLVGSAQHGLFASKQAGQQKHHDCKRVRVWCGCDLVVSLSPVSMGKPQFLVNPTSTVGAAFCSAAAAKGTARCLFVGCHFQGCNLLVVKELRCVWVALCKLKLRGSGSLLCQVEQMAVRCRGQQRMLLVPLPCLVGKHHGVEIVD
jgi:hypothetical protein